MGLFSKEPAEKKAYGKAFDSARSKPCEKTFAELEKACEAWGISWQGYLLMGICYDLGAGVPFDENKAAGYHAKAKEAGRKCNAEWLEFFYEYYEQDASNFKAEGEYFPRTLNVRRAGVAMLFCYYINKNGILPKGVLGTDDLKFWDKIFSSVDKGGLFKSSPEQSQVYNHLLPFTTFINHFNFYKGAKNDASDDNQKVKNLNEMQKYARKFDKLNPDQVTVDSIDTYGFIVGCALFFGGAPYLIRGEGWYQNVRINGWIAMWHCAMRGCVPAVHALATYIEDDSFEFGEEIYFAASKSYHDIETKSQVRAELCYYLKKCAEKGDQHAAAFLNELNG